MAIIALLVAGSLGPVAHAYSPSDLTVIEIKMTGSETVVLENTSPAAINLSDYLVQYFNKTAPTSLAVPTNSQQLPAIVLAPRETILLTSDSSATCGAAAVANQSFSMSDSAGLLQVVKVGSQAGSLLLTPQDHVSWTTSASGADLTRVPSNTTDPNSVWYRNLASGDWQQADLSGNCAAVVSLLTPANDTSFVSWAEASEPPAIIIATEAVSDGAAIPSEDIGLAAPQITELMPNPASPLTDAEDEFIELYNPNQAEFDLSGFKLSAGTTSNRTYTLPAGTTIAPKSFKTFLSIDTNLALSNSGGQVRLLDPFGNVINQTDVYTGAKEGQSWARANGRWYWTGTPTPNASNVINQTGTTGKSSKSSGGKTSSAVKGAATTNLNLSPTDTVNSAAPTATVHPWTIAVIGSMALLYAAYEYRLDLANRYNQFRRYVEARRTAGK